ncbi:MAG: hypothetical protein HZB19_19415 [Chloroflexi bacterium]|nr:hypothetical protein [Chloroflexota bacterium]
MIKKELLSRSRDTLVSSYEKTLLRAYFEIFGHAVHQRFAILGNARTGSNYLLDGLKSSKSIKMYHEIFADHNRRKGRDFEKILSSLYQKQDKSICIIGFKVFYNHLTEDEWQKFQSHTDYRIIHLTRRNRLRTIVSLDVAFKTGQWTKSSKAIDKHDLDKRIVLDSSSLLERLEKIENDEHLARERFKDRPVLEVVYEEMVREPMQIFQAVGEYLGVTDIDPSHIKIKKQNPEHLGKIIVNYDEVQRVLRDTRFAVYLSE